MNKLLLSFALLLLTFLTGCVRYDVGVNFDNQQKGEIVQYVKIGEQFTSFNQSEAKKWLSSIENRAQALHGSIERTSPQEITVTIPFGNGKELAAKFNSFFNPESSTKFKALPKGNLDLVQLNSQMSLNQKNLLLFERDRLSLNVDLRALGVLSSQGKLIVSPGSLIDLKFQLRTPWGGRSLISSDALRAEKLGNLLIWQLEPGQINHIEAVFWIPSYLGLGTVAIAALMIAGFYLKYKRLPLIDREFSKNNFASTNLPS
jgi:hypothetical protein